MKKSVYFLIALIIAFVGIKVFMSVKTLDAVVVKKCSEFGTQQIAQDAFESNQKEYAWADRDHDGKACESLPKTLPINN